MNRSCCLAMMVVLFVGLRITRADGLADNIPEKVRPIPPPGMVVHDEHRKLLDDRLGELNRAIQALEAKADPKTTAILPDVRIFARAVHDALEYGEFFEPAELDAAEALLREGRERADQLAKGDAPWTRQTGLVMRGYVSKLDGSVQPYGLVIPESYTFAGKDRYRLDLWFHGRMETLSEVNFLDGRSVKFGDFTPADTFVLHPYGRFCNAFKLAGEVDVLEALESVKDRYRVDEDRIAARGFSMGGAATWHLAVHYSDRWFAANPGAGFAETPRFLDVFQKETLAPTWYERKLWHLYDCPDWVENLRHCPTVAYSGELDVQKQAADVMAEAFERAGMRLRHVIGAGTKHAYEPGAKREVADLMASLAEHGRERAPRRVGLTTYTLRYNRMNWVTIDALGTHWEPARVEAQIANDTRVIVVTRNVEALTLEMSAGWCPLRPDSEILITLAGSDGENQSDDQPLHVPGPLSDRSWRVQLHKDGNTWALGPLPHDGLRKRHGLQGPVDDAFLDSFLFVMPSGESRHPAVASWVEAESRRAVARWRSQFRGQARVKTDAEVTEADIASANLVLWGDPDSNALLKQVAPQLPISWNGERVRVGERSFDAGHQVPILIYPNPLNPGRYVVLNSGFTYREYDDLNNARQVPKLPDWGIVDVLTPPSSSSPGKVVAADFFGESWELRPPREPETGGDQAAPKK